MKTKLLLLTLLMPLCVWGQTNQQGYVMEYHGKEDKTPLSMVSISVKNAPTTSSQEDGSFQLAFRELLPGDKINIRSIHKAGYEIFNQEALDEWRVSSDNTPFVIILCKSENLRALKEQYYSLASKSYREQCAKEQSELEALFKAGKLMEEEYYKKIREVVNYYENQLDNIDSYIDRFARIDLSQINSDEEEIISLVQKGDIDGAIEKYNKMNLLDNYVLAVSQRDVLRKDIEQLRQEEKKREKILGEMFDKLKNKHSLMCIKGGEESFRMVGDELCQFVDADTTYMPAVKHCVHFLMSQHRLELAEKYCHIALNALEKEKNTDAGYAAYILMYENLAKMYEFSGRLNDAINLYEFLLNDINEYKSTKTVAVIYLKASLLSDIGALYCANNDEKKGFPYLLESKECFEYLYSLDKEEFAKSYASLLEKIGTVYARDFNVGKVKEYVALAFEVLNSCGVKEDTYEVLYLKVNLNSLLVEVSARENKIEEAIEYCGKTVNDGKLMYELNPDRYCAVYARQLMILARILSYTDRNDDILSTCKTGIEVLEKMEIRRNDSLDLLSRLYHMCATATFYADLTAAKQYEEKAYEIFLPLYQSSPAYNSIMYSILCEGLMMSNYLSGDLEKAIYYGYQGLDANITSCNANPNTENKSALCETVSNLAYLLVSVGRYQDSNELYGKYLHFAEELYALGYEDCRLDYTRYLANSSLPKIYMKKYKEAEKLLNKALSLYVTDPRDMKQLEKNQYMNTLSFRAYIWLKKGQKQKAVEQWNDIIRLMPDFVDYNPDNMLYLALKEEALIK